MTDWLHKIEASNGTAFQKAVWRALCDIPKGQTLTYAQLADKIGKPGAARAVANACGKNPFAPDVPCHRVTGSKGYLGGYSASGGVEAKHKMLQQEGAL